MKIKKFLAIPVLVLISLKLFSQAIDQNASFRNISNDKYMRLHYENDYFTASDKYYTQGINLELVCPVMKFNPVNFLLFKLHGPDFKYGLAVEHNGYTPSSIRHSEILENDHPFAACLFLKSFVISADQAKNIRLSSGISIGVIGHLANGDWMQKSIHKWTGNVQPLGWENQVQNDIILNYEISGDKKIISYKNSILINAFGEIKAGTLSDQAGIGIVFMAGKFLNPFENNTVKNERNRNRKFYFYFYDQPLIDLIGYNATLQGGVINKNSPYVIQSGEIERVVLKNNAGIVISMGKFYFEYFQTIQSGEFKEGSGHRWGGVRFGFSF